MINDYNQIPSNKRFISVNDADDVILYYFCFYSFPKFLFFAVVCDLDPRRFDSVKNKYKINLDKSKVNL